MILNSRLVLVLLIVFAVSGFVRVASLAIPDQPQPVRLFPVKQPP